MTTYGALLADSRTNMDKVLASMCLIQVSVMFIPIVFLSDDSMFSGAGGAIVCSILWVVYVVFYFSAILILAIKKSETAAMTGCFLAWVYPMGLLMIGASIAIIFYTSLLSMILTLYIWRMLRYIYQLAKMEPSGILIEPPPPQEPPELRLYP